MLPCVAIGYVERVSSAGREISKEEGAMPLIPSSTGFGLDAINLSIGNFSNVGILWIV